jgi:mRNA-degrading endonuclease HigB of HigAB toxin-antitoxin module
MKILDIEMIHDFAKDHADARTSLARWIQETKAANWQSPDDIKAALSIRKYSL